MADELNPRPLDPPTHTLREVTPMNPKKGKVLSASGTSANLTRNSRVVSDKVIFVDNIADTITQEDFVDMMSQYAVCGAIIDIKFLTRTKGSSFAFVEFETEQDGKTAILGLNKKDFTTSSGKVLELRASKAENPTETVSNKNLYVKGLPRHWSNEDLKRRFRGFGSISHCRTLKRPGSSTENTGVGFVHFYNSVDALKAIEEVDDKLADVDDPQSGVLEVKFARSKKPQGGSRNQRRQGRRGARGRGGPQDFNRTHMGPSWNAFTRGNGMVGGRGRNMRGGNHGRGGYGGMPSMDQVYGKPNQDTDMWTQMMELMQNMGGMMANQANQNNRTSMWQNPYNVYGGSYQTYGGGYTRNTAGDSVPPFMPPSSSEHAMPRSPLSLLTVNAAANQNGF